ncbi:alginate export family protein [Nitrospiraceae bacterium AH_259_D15_M11_P09]|nr:alginate export family protein [Nitrospiraceae bacterium AH_259_D15_M11_P09]
MKLLTNGLKWFTAVAVAVAGIGLGGGSLIAPDPAFAKFEMDKLTISGDIRVRPEFRRGSNFGAGNAKSNDQFIQERIRLGIAYDVSPDVRYFLEIQDSRNWGKNNTSAATSTSTSTSTSACPLCAGPITTTTTTTTTTTVSQGENAQNNPAGTLGVRQGYIAVKNAGVRNLSLKIGRQKVIFGNHRLLGSFDWNNNGWSFDGIRADYGMAQWSTSLLWIRVVEGDCADINSGACAGSGTAGATADGDLFVLYNTFKGIPGMTIEPYWMAYFDSRAAAVCAAGNCGTRAGRTQADQRRHIFGARIDGKAANKMLDFTAEGAWQTGSQDDGSGTQRDARINAAAFAVKGGVTLQNVMWKPRFGFEVDYATGSGRAAGDRTGAHTFEGLFPTNHAHYGFMDRAAWKNIVDYSPQLMVRPDKASNLKINLHILRLAQKEDNWYGAAQTRISTTSPTNQENSLGKELDIVYTRKFKEGKFGLQIGYGHFFTGQYGARSVDGSGQGGTTGNRDQDWGYVSVTTKF